MHEQRDVVVKNLWATVRRRQRRGGAVLARARHCCLRLGALKRRAQGRAGLLWARACRHSHSGLAWCVPPCRTLGLLAPTGRHLRSIRRGFRHGGVRAQSARQPLSPLVMAALGRQPLSLATPAPALPYARHHSWREQGLATCVASCAARGAGHVNRPRSSRCCASHAAAMRSLVPPTSKPLSSLYSLLLLLSVSFLTDWSLGGALAANLLTLPRQHKSTRDHGSLLQLPVMCCRLTCAAASSAPALALLQPLALRPPPPPLLCLPMPPPLLGTWRLQSRAGKAENRAEGGQRQGAQKGQLRKHAST